MEEVHLRLRFTRASLGDVQRKSGSEVVFCMPRGPSGQVMFVPAWWRSIARFAAKVTMRPADLVARIEWDPLVDGVPVRQRRYLAQATPSGRRRFAWHEAFPQGEEIGVNCVLPPGLSVDDLRELMDTAGRYKGISPYRPGQFGNFSVVAVLPGRTAR